MRSSGRRSPRVAALLVIGVLAASACGAGDDGADDGAGDGGAASVGAPTSALAPVPDEVSPAAPPADDPPATAATPADGNAGIEPDEPAEPDTSDVPAAVPDAPEILRFSAPVVGGGEIDLAAFGERPLLLWFWAPF